MDAVGLLCFVFKTGVLRYNGTLLLLVFVNLYYLLSKAEMLREMSVKEMPATQRA